MVLVCVRPNGAPAICTRAPQAGPAPRAQEPTLPLARGLEARRPATFGGWGDGVGGDACRRALLRVAASRKEASPLRGLLAGAVWTAVRVQGHRLRDTAAGRANQAWGMCSSCGSRTSGVGVHTHGRTSMALCYTCCRAPQPPIEAGRPSGLALGTSVRGRPGALGECLELGPGDVSWAEVNLEFEIYVGQVLTATRAMGHTAPVGRVGASPAPGRAAGVKALGERRQTSARALISQGSRYYAGLVA